MPALAIREDRSPGELRCLAKAERDVRVARRLLAIANALSGMSRAAAARSAGMDRQTLRDWVIRYNADGIEGLADRWGDGRPPRLDADQQAELAQVILAGPDPEVDGISAYTLEDLALICAERSASRCIALPCAGWASRGRRHGRTTPTRTRPRKRLLGGLGDRLKAVADAHPGQRIRLMFEDEARIGQKGRVCHR